MVEGDHHLRKRPQPLPTDTEMLNENKNSSNGINHFYSHMTQQKYTSQYRKTSNISRTLIGNKIVDNYRRCSNYIFILNFTPGFNGLSEDNCKRIQETFEFWNLVRLIQEVLR